MKQLGQRFADKVVIITGSSSGFRLEMAKNVAEDGAMVVTISRSEHRADAIIAAAEARFFVGCVATTTCREWGESETLTGEWVIRSR